MLVCTHRQHLLTHGTDYWPVNVEIASLTPLRAVQEVSHSRGETASLPTLLLFLATASVAAAQNGADFAGTTTYAAGCYRAQPDVFAGGGGPTGIAMASLNGMSRIISPKKGWLPGSCPSLFIANTRLKHECIQVYAS